LTDENAQSVHGTERTIGQETSEDFDFSKGDDVLVRVREHGNSGNPVGKFEATCIGFTEGVLGSSDSANLEPAWGDDLISFSPDEAEFEAGGEYR